MLERIGGRTGGLLIHLEIPAAALAAAHPADVADLEEAAAAALTAAAKVLHPDPTRGALQGTVKLRVLAALAAGPCRSGTRQGTGVPILLSTATATPVKTLRHELARLERDGLITVDRLAPGPGQVPRVVGAEITEAGREYLLRFPAAVAALHG